MSKFDELLKKHNLKDDEEEKKNSTTSVSNNKSRFEELLEKHTASTMDIDSVSEWFKQAEKVVTDLSKEDTSKYSTNWGGQYLETANKLRAQAEDVWKFLYNNKESISNYEEMDSLFGKVNDALTSATYHGGQINKYFSQWSSESAYKNSQDQYKYDTMTLEDLNAEEGKYKKDNETLDRAYGALIRPVDNDKGILDLNALSPDQAADLKYLASNYGLNLNQSSYDVQNDIMQLQGKAGNGVLYYDASGAAVTYDTLRRIKGTNTKIENIQAAPDTKTAYDNLMGYRDDIKKLENASAALQAMQEGIPVSEDLQADLDYISQKYGISIDPSATPQQKRDQIYQIYMQLIDGSYEGIATNKAILAAKGYDWDELSYYHDYVDDKNARIEQMQRPNGAAQTPILSTIMGIASAPFQIFDLAKDMVDKSRADGKAADSAYGLANIYDNDAMYFSQGATTGVAQGINDFILDATGNKVLAWLGSTAYSGASSALQSAAITAPSVALFGPAAGGKIALAVLGSQAAASQYVTAIQNGSTQNRALVSAVAAGVAEGFFEKFSMDRLINTSFKMDTSSFKNYVKSLWHNSGNLALMGVTEASEELATSISNRITDDIINGNHSAYYTSVDKYMRSGMSRDEAEHKASIDYAKELAESALGGFFGGLSTGGAGTTAGTFTGLVDSIGNEIDSHKENKFYGNSYKGDTEMVQALIDTALETAEGSESRQIAEKLQAKLDSGKKISGKELKNLTKANEQQFRAEDTDKIRTAAEGRLTRLGESSDVAKVAGAITRQFVGEELTTAEKTALENSQYGRQVANELSSGSSWAANLETDRITIEANDKTSQDVVESKYETSDNGETFNNKTGEGVKIVGITSIKDGEMTLKVENSEGETETVNAKDLSLSESDALIYSSVVDMGASPEAAWNIAKNFKASDGVSAEVYAADVPLAYKYGVLNYREGLSKLDLTTDQAMVAFYQGRNDSDAKLKSEAKQTPATDSKKKNVARVKGKVVFEGFEYDENSANDLQKASMAGINLIAEMSSLEVHVYKSFKENGKLYTYVDGKKRLAPNGYFKTGTNKVYIDLNAGMNGEGLMLDTAGHEIGHYMAENAWEDFKEYADFLFEHYGENVPVDELINRQKQRIIEGHKMDGKAIPSEDKLFKMAYVEVVCDASTKMLADENAYIKLAELKKQNKTLWEKIGEAIKNLLDKFKSVIGMYSNQTTTQEAMYVEQFSKEVFDKLQDLYIKAFVKADENFNAVGANKMSTDTNTVASAEQANQYQGRDENGKKTLDSYTETQYNNFGWVRYNDVLSAAEHNTLLSRYADYKHNKDKYPVTRWGEAVISSTECLDVIMYVKGSITSPQITKVVRIVADDFTDISIIREEIISNEYEQKSQPYSFIEAYYGPEFLVISKARDYASFQRYRSESQGRDSSKDVAVGKIKQDGTGSSSESNGTNSQNSEISYSERDNAPIFYSQMGKVVEGVKQEKLAANSVVNMLRGKGVKAEEIRWSGIVPFLEGKKSVTKQELLDFINSSMLQIGEQMSSNDIDLRYDSSNHSYSLYGKDGNVIDTFTYNEFMGGYISETDEEFYSNAVELEDALREEYGSMASPRWSDYKLNGGSNYREIVFTMPNSSYSNQMMRAHWGDDAEGVLAHARIQDFKTNGKKMLFIEEIQSDWHNEGHKKGYRKLDAKTMEEIGEESAKAYREFYETVEGFLTENGQSANPALVANLFYGEKDAYDYLSKLVDLTEEEMRYISSEVAKETERRQQSETAPSDTDAPDAPFKENYHEFVLKKLLRMAAEQGYDSIGWTPADIQSERWSDEFAEGYRIEYDQDIPKFLRKYGRQWGAKVEKSTLPNGTEVWSMDITDSMKESVLKEGQALYSERDFNPITETEYRDLEKHFGTTSNFKVAGYLLTDGRLLDFSGKHWGDTTSRMRQVDHRDVQEILSRGNNGIDDMISMIGSGNIRLMPEIGGINLAVYPNEKQRRVLSVYINYMLNTEGEVVVDYDAVGGDTVYSKVYGKTATARQILNDIRNYFKGARQSELMSFHTMGDEALFQDRDSDSVSNRSLLANSLESAAQNDIEKNKLAEYKKKISLIEAEEKRLSEIQKQLFTKDAVEPAKRKELQFEAKQISNRINTYDRQLLNLEATTALKNVLNREKALAMKRQKQKDAENMRAYKEKVAKTQRELLDKWQTSRKNAVEGRNKTAMRHKIKGVVGELNQLLLRGTKDKHVMIGLQKAVAEALDAVNMDTVGADERVAKYNALIAKAKDPDVIASLTETRDRIQGQGDKMNERLTKLKNAYNDIKNSDDPLIANSYDEVITSRIEAVIEKVGNTPLRDMTLEQLEDVYDMYKMVLTVIRNSNKAFKSAKNESIATLGNRVMMEVEKVGGNHPLSRKALEGIKSFEWNSLKPIYAFRVIGSDTLTDIYNNVRAGEDTWARDVNEARDFYREKTKKYNFDSWDFKKTRSFTSTSGKNFELSLEQIMSLYAYSKREQADLHLQLGGFVFDSSIEVTKKSKLGIPLKYTVKTADAYNLSQETLSDIIGTLSAEQKAFVDEMQGYLSTVMGEKGNEVSLEMYGVKLFKEKNYFPLKSAKQFMFEQSESAGEVRIKNSGFSKETVAKANNPIILNNFTDVWTNHVNDMSMYHAFVLALEDFNRVYNYKTPTSDNMATESVKMFLQNAYGNQASQYIKNLITDLNGGVRVDPAADPINKGIGAFKKAAVFASASVVIQQPSAIARALAHIDSKYFITRLGLKDHGKLWSEVKKYAPVAIIKEMGRFDTHIGQQTTDWIKSTEYKGIVQKTKALFTDSAYRDDLLSRAPALADELAWCYIWNAVKKETKATTNLQVGSEEFLKKCGERFTEIATLTQVYDSVLSRSAIMRSKDTGVKMATSFMAEPTTAMNMAVDAVIQGKRGNKKFARKAVGAVAASIILNSILVSLVYAARDDDEDETYAEKYIGSLTSELLDGFNPLTYIPIVKDALSITQGYDVERSDMALWSKLVDAFDNLFKENLSAKDKVIDFAGTVANLFGLPLKNIVRDAEAIFNLTNNIMNGTQTTGAGIKYSVVDAIRNTLPFGDKYIAEDSNAKKLYDAIVSGDEVQIERMKGRFKDDKAIETALRKALRENDPRIIEAAQARIDGDIARYTSLVKEIKAEGHFGQDTIVAAINAEINAINKGEGTTQAPAEDKEASIYKLDDLFAAVANGDRASANTVRDDMIRIDVANGKSQEDAEENFNGRVTSRCREEYEEGNLTAREVEDILVNYGGKTEEEAANKVLYWDFKEDYPDVDMSEEALIKYYDQVESSGISMNVYVDYYEKQKECKGVDANGDGKTDSGSKKAQVLKVIDSLPISKSQKDALYFLNGWAKSTLHEAPWR